ncbi:MAG TPA: hypothetical protein VG755_09860, partial [Nannocystaceae bacterium]|nr:hypothetical protein [Nannocystaceae bacterium]
VPRARARPASPTEVTMARALPFVCSALLGGCLGAADPRDVGAGAEGGIDSVGSDDGDPVAQTCTEIELDALTVLQDHCVACHVPGGGAAFDWLTDIDRMIAEGMLRPGDAGASPLFDAAMDQHAPAPDAAELVEVARWIDECLQAQPCVADHTIGTDGMLALVQQDLVGEVSTSARPFARYFTLAHRYDAGDCGEQLDAERQGLAKVLSSLSWAPQAVAPVAIDADATIFRIDLRDYDWDAQTWQTLVQADPYAIAYTREEATDIVAFTQCDVPVMRADWLVAAATVAPLYYEILGLPSTRAELEALLGVDIDGDIAADEVVRAGFLESGVSRHNRVIERHALPGGPDRSLWTSYDFAAAAGSSDVFAHPLDFVPAAQLHMFTLPNGMHAYMISDAAGQRVDRLSDEIAIDLAEPDQAIVAGRSCMRCHGGGVIPKGDELLAHVSTSLAFDDATREKIERLHPAAAQLLEVQQRDADAYASALAQIGVPTLGDEPVDATTTNLDQDVDLALAAAELGLPSDLLLTHLGALPAELLPLADGVIQRETFASVFADVVCTLELGDTSACGLGASACCVAGDGPGCGDEECESLVCDLWPECCAELWSSECAARAGEWACACE